MIQVAENNIQVELRGAPLKLLRRILKAQKENAPLKVWECLVEGPAGSGKSRGVLSVLYWMLRTFPNIRILAVRATRSALTESVLKTWEQDVLPPGDSMRGGRSREGRHSYVCPETGAEFVTGGLGDANEELNLYSTDYDVIFVEEAVQVTEDQWEKNRRALRNWKGGLRMQILIACTNPDAPGHWLNQRAMPGGRCERFLSRHEDNPAFFTRDGLKTEKGAAYIESLDSLTGMRYRRLRKGEWCAAEGAVWPEYDPLVHLINAPPALEKADGKMETERERLMRGLGIRWFAASVDWGYTAPGCLQVWGFDGDKRAYRCVEIYFTEKQIDWWAERAVELAKEFQLRAIICDPARNDAIELFNDRLGSPGGRDTPRLARGADNRRASDKNGDLGGLDLVRWGLSADKTGTPRMFFLRDAHRFGRDPARVALAKPCCFEDECPSYVWLLDPNREKQPDRTDPDCEDHALDPTRYMMSFAWKKDLSDLPPPPSFPAGSIGFDLGKKNPEIASEWRKILNTRNGRR